MGATDLAEPRQIIHIPARHLAGTARVDLQFGMATDTATDTIQGKSSQPAASGTVSAGWFGNRHGTWQED